MTFYGESAALDWANPVSGTPFTDYGSAMQYRDGAGPLLSAGDSFIAGFYMWEDLEATSEAVFSLAIETSGSGSATIRVSGGIDPDWSLSDPGLATSPLGTFTANGSGASTLVIPASFIDVNTYYEQEVEHIFYVEVLSGSVTVDQMRLRIWPPGGPSGAWVPAPSFEIITDCRVASVAIGNDSTAVNVEGGAWDMAGAWANAMAQSKDRLDTMIASDALGLARFAYRPQIGGAYARCGSYDGVSASEDGLKSTAGASVTFNVLYVGPPDPRLISYAPSVTPGRDVDRVYGDPASSVRNKVDGGNLLSQPTAWVSNPTLEVSAISGTYPGVDTYYLLQGVAANWPVSQPYPSNPQLGDEVVGAIPMPQTAATIAEYVVPQTGGGETVIDEIESPALSQAITALYVVSPIVGGGTDPQNVTTGTSGSSSSYSGGIYVRITAGQYRHVVPEGEYWEPTAPYVGGGGDGGGTGWDNQWGDWYVPGWGNWDWFPDYDWDANPDYPDYPDYNDYYIPIETLPTYHYLPFDLNTNTQLGEIPLEDVSYSHKLSAPGTANFSIPVTPETIKQQVKAASIPGKSGLYIIRDNQIAWGGIIWKRQYDSSSRRVRFEAGSFESYFDHRFQSNVLGFEDVDQMTIARTLALQAADEMHIDVDPATSGVNRYYNAFYYDFKTIGGELDGLASLWDGFDWNVRVYLDTNGVIRRRLVWGYPQLGVSAANSTLLFEYPGSVRSYTINADADKAGNRVWAIGGGQGLDQIQYESRDDAQLASGFPLLETTTSYKDVFQPARLEARSKQDLERLRPPVTILNIEVDPFSDPKLGTYNPGDWARFVLGDSWNNPGVDIVRRIVGYNVSVNANSPLDRVSLEIDAGDTT